MPPIAYCTVIRGKDRSLRYEVRDRMVKLALEDGIKPTARYYGVSRNTVRKWLRRYQETRVARLQERSRAPHYIPHKTPARVEDKVIRLKKRLKRFGSRRLVRDYTVGCSHGAFDRICREHGLLRRRRRKRARRNDLRAVKARYRRLAGMLTLILKGDKRGLKFMQSLKLDGTTRVTMGGSLAARATYCEELVDKNLIEKLFGQPRSTLYCRNREVLTALKKSCLSFSRNKKHFDVSRRLNTLNIPALIFAGKLDPLVPWQATASVAARLPNASFLLIHGGHTPIKAGGRCFADAVERFAQGKPLLDHTCNKHPAR